MGGWDPGGPGVLPLPSGRLVRGRSLRRAMPAGEVPEFALHLLATPATPLPWEVRCVRWPDFRLPSNRRDAEDALTEAWTRSATERVEIACSGGLGRTGTALACLAVLDGVPPGDAVAYVRHHYSSRSVETRAQRRYVEHFSGGGHRNSPAVDPLPPPRG